MKWNRNPRIGDTVLYGLAEHTVIGIRKIGDTVLLRLKARNEAILYNIEDWKVEVI